MTNERLSPFFSLVLLFLVAPALGLLVSPWVYQLLQHVANEGSVFDAKFHRVAARVTLVAVALFLYPAYRLSGLQCRVDCGLSVVSNRALLVRRGAILGAASMLLVYCIGLKTGVFAWDAGDGTVFFLIRKTVQIAIGGFAVGVFEEILFRGFVFGALRKSVGLITAIVFGSLFFSVVHLMRPLNPDVINQWNSGFLLLCNPFARAAQTLWQEAGTLFFMGVILSLVCYWTKSIYTAIGLHAGWIWVMMFFRLFTDNQRNLVGIFGTTDWISKAWIGVAFSVFLFLLVLLTRKKWQRLAPELLTI